MELLKNVKKILVYIGITLVFGVACIIGTICICGNRHDKRTTKLKQQLEQQTLRNRELISSARIGTREMARDIEETTKLNKQLIEGITGSRETTRANINRIRESIIDSGRIDRILTEIITGKTD